MRDTILILGGAGFIGSHLAARHVAIGDDVHLAVRPGWDGSAAWPVDGAVAHEVDLASDDAVATLLAAVVPTVVYHLASRTAHGPNGLRDPYATAWFDDPATLVRLLAAAERVRPALRAFVRVGSLAEYGDGPVPALEEQRETPRAPYGLAQATATRFAELLAPTLRFPVLTARLGLTYGPGQSREFLVPALIRCCFERKPYLVRDPLARRDMIYVDDVVTGLMKLANADLPGGGIVNLCTGQAPTNRSIAQTVCEVTGTPPDRIAYGSARRSAPASIVLGSAERARTLLRWSARIGLAAGIALTADALAAHAPA